MILFGKINACTIKWALKRRSEFKSSLTCVAYSSVVIVKGRLIFLRSYKKTLCHRYTWRFDKYSSVKAEFTTVKVSTADLHCFARNLMTFLCPQLRRIPGCTEDENEFRGKACTDFPDGRRRLSDREFESCLSAQPVPTGSRTLAFPFRLCLCWRQPISLLKFL